MKLAKRGLPWKVSEPSGAAREIAEQRYGLSLYAGSIQDQAFPQECFDVIFANHVLEHLMDPLCVSELVWRWLKPNGLFLAEVPNEFGNIRSRYGRLLRRMEHQPRSLLSIHHTVFFTPATLALLAARAGFREVRIRSIYNDRRLGTSGLVRRLPHPRLAMARVAASIWGGPVIELLARK